MLSAYNTCSYSLKTLYIKFRNELGQTGHGLVTEGCEDEITPGSELANVWGMCLYRLPSLKLTGLSDATLNKFPWYRRMDKLLAKSPLVVKSAVGHSKTPIDTAILSRHVGASQQPAGLRAPSPTWDIEDGADQGLDETVEGLLASSPVRGSHLGSPGLDDSLPASDEDEPAPRSSQQPQTAPKTSTSAPARGQKRKQMHEALEDIADKERRTRLKLSVEQMREKTKRVDIKYKEKFEFQRLQLEFQREEAEKNRLEMQKQREHELLLLEKKIMLERTMRGLDPSM